MTEQEKKAHIDKMYELLFNKVIAFRNKFPDHCPICILFSVDPTKLREMDDRGFIKIVPVSQDMSAVNRLPELFKTMGTGGNYKSYLFGQDN